MMDDMSKGFVVRDYGCDAKCCELIWGTCDVRAGHVSGKPEGAEKLSLFPVEDLYREGARVGASAEGVFGWGVEDVECLTHAFD
ncbi:hypothetical protein SARC_16457, partial [Sphaeroforma arctica JP610]